MITCRYCPQVFDPDNWEGWKWDRKRPHGKVFFICPAHTPIPLFQTNARGEMV